MFCSDDLDLAALDRAGARRVNDFGGLGSDTHRFNENFELGLGVALGNVFDEPLPLPAAKIDWQITERLSLDAILPQNINLTWLAMDRRGLRASATIGGNSYHGSPKRFGVDHPQVNYSSGQAELGVL